MATVLARLVSFCACLVFIATFAGASFLAPSARPLKQMTRQELARRASLNRRLQNHHQPLVGRANDVTTAATTVAAKPSPVLAPEIPESAPMCDGSTEPQLFAPAFARYQGFAAEGRRLVGNDIDDEDLCLRNCGSNDQCRGVEWFSTGSRTSCRQALTNADAGLGRDDVPDPQRMEESYYAVKGIVYYIKGECADNRGQVLPAMDRVCCNVL